MTTPTTVNDFDPEEGAYLAATMAVAWLGAEQAQRVLERVAAHQARRYPTHPVRCADERHDRLRAERDLLEARITRWHNDAHAGPVAMCTHPLCEAVWEITLADDRPATTPDMVEVTA